MIYFDSSATTLQKPPEVYRAMRYAMNHFASPGRGGHKPAMDAADAVYVCRRKAAALFDAEPEQIVFTMNATHALNIAIRTLVHPGDRVVISGFEHNAVVRPLHWLKAEVAVAGRRVFDTEDTCAAFECAMTPHTKAVVCTHVSNVFGYILPIEEIAALCRERNIPLIVDASQSAGVLPLSLKKLGAAFLAMPGHKGLYGPQGTGMLICGQVPEPLMQGGSGSLSRQAEMPAFLPDIAEAGTHNVVGIHALSAGLDYVQKKGMEEILRHEIRLRRVLEDGLSNIPGVRLFSGAAQSGVLSFLYAQEDCEETAQRLAQAKIAVRAGLQCAPLAHESVGTLESGTVRVSFSAVNREREIRAFLKAVKKYDVG